MEVWLDEWASLRPDAARLDAVNPAITPRNHIVEEVLAAAVQGDLGPFDQLVGLLHDPFTAHDSPLAQRLAVVPPDTAAPFVTFCGT